MKSVIGYCKYCGQSKLIEVPDSYEQDTVNEDVTDKCNCAEAMAESSIKAMITHTEYQLKEILKEHEQIKELSIKNVEPLARNVISKYSIGFGSYVLKLTRKMDKISISLKYTEEEKRE